MPSHELDPRAIGARRNGLTRGRALTVLAIVIAGLLFLGLAAVYGQGLKQGTGYTPRSNRVVARSIAGGPVDIFTTGNPAADPWSIACRGRVGMHLRLCLAGRDLPTDRAPREEVCAEYLRAFGVRTCGQPAGGWAYGPGNERFGAAKNALEYFCRTDPAFIGSTGAAGGWDCTATGADITRLGAFGGEYVITEHARRDPQDGSTPPPSGTPPAARCGNARLDPGETCRNCPQDAGGCPPPVETPPANVDSVDCSGLALGSGEQPLGLVAYRPSLASTGRVEIRLIPCRPPQ